MFSFSENKSHLVKTVISKGRGDVQKQNSESCQFFKCPICSFRTPLRGDLQKHISMYHKQVFACKICDYKFSSKDDLAAHKELCPLKTEEVRVYSSRKCGSKFDNAKIFAVHVKVTCLKGDFIKDTGKKDFHALFSASQCIRNGEKKNTLSATDFLKPGDWSKRWLDQTNQ